MFLGTYCPVGSFEQTQCPVGTYQPEGTSETCLPCEPGFTCPYTGMATGIACPAGKFCWFVFIGECDRCLPVQFANNFIVSRHCKIVIRVVVIIIGYIVAVMATY